MILRIPIDHSLYVDDTDSSMFRFWVLRLFWMKDKFWCTVNMTALYTPTTLNQNSIKTFRANVFADRMTTRTHDQKHKLWKKYWNPSMSFHCVYTPSSSLRMRLLFLLLWLALLCRLWAETNNLMGDKPITLLLRCLPFCLYSWPTAKHRDEHKKLN